jgi:hypothetical protein
LLLKKREWRGSGFLDEGLAVEVVTKKGKEKVRASLEKYT